MKFFKRSTSPRPVPNTNRKLSQKIVDGVDDGPLDLSGSSSRASAGSGGSWERWRPTPGGRVMSLPRRESDRASYNRRNLFEVTARNGARAVREWDLRGDLPQGLAVAVAAEAAEVSGPDEAESAVSNGSSGASSSMAATQQQQRRRQRRGRGPRRRRVLASINIVKGADGFGFTVMTARHGQKVNSIIEEDRCAGLRRGDLLLSINGADLAGLGHEEIVNLLRVCPEGVAAVLIVRRRESPAADETAEKILNGRNQVHEAASGFRENSAKNGRWSTSPLAGTTDGSAGSGDVPPVPARNYRLSAPVDAPLDVTKTSGAHIKGTSASMRHGAAATAKMAAVVASGAAAAAAAAALTTRIDPAVSVAGDGDEAVGASSSQADLLNVMRRSLDDTSTFMNGRLPHQASLASLPPRQPVEPLWRWQQWYQQQRQRQPGPQLQSDQQQQQQQQQRIKSAQPLLPEGIRVTTLDELQQRYFRQWKQAQLTSGDARRPPAAAAAAAASTETSVSRWTESVVVIGDDGETAHAPPPLPPRPSWRRAQSLGALQKQQPEPQQPQQQHEFEKPRADRSTVVPPASAVTSSTSNKVGAVAPWEVASRSRSRSSGSAHLLQPPDVGRSSKKQEQQPVKQSVSSQPTAAIGQRSSSISPVRSATAARARQDHSPNGDVRTRNLHLLRNLALSAPSLQQSAAGTFHSGTDDSHNVPHFATLGRRPAKPNSLRVRQSTDGSASGSSSGQGAARQGLRSMADAQATVPPSAALPTAAATWDRRSSRSRTPEGTFWRRTQHLHELRRSDETDDGAAGREADDVQPTRPASSASHRRRVGISMGTAAAAAAAAAASASLAPTHAENGLQQSEPADARDAATRSPVSPQRAGAADAAAAAAAVAASTTSGSPPSQRRMLPLPPPTSADVGVIERRVPVTPSIVASASDARETAAAAAAGRSELNQQTQSIPVGRIQPVEIDVTIYRQESGFGFCVVGGPEGGTQVTVGRIAPGGAADLDGSLRPGDEILAVDGVPTQGASHYRVIQLMGNAASRSKVDLRVRRRMLIQAAQHPTWADGAADHVDLQQTPRAPATVNQHPPYPALHRQSSASVALASTCATAQHTPPWSVSAPLTSAADDSRHLAAISSCSITLTQQASDEGFGIVIVTPRLQPHERLAEVKIGQIHPNSPAARCGRLFVGDRILFINGVPVSGLAHDAVVALIKERGRTVTIAVAAGEPATAVSPAVAVSLETGERLLVNRYDMTTGTDHHHSRAQASFDATASAGEELNRQDSFLEVSAVPCVGQSCPDTPELSAAGRGGRLHADLGTNPCRAFCNDDRDRVPCSPTYEGAGLDQCNLHWGSGSKLETQPQRPGSQRFQAAAVARSDTTTRAAAGSGNGGTPYWPSSSMSLRFGGSYCQLDSVDAAVAASHSSVPPHDNPCAEPWSPASTRGPLVRSTTLPLSQPVTAAELAVPSATNVQQPPNVFTVDLTQDGKGFGFSVRGGHEFGAAPLCVLRLAPGGAADRSGKLQVGDEILAINGRRTTGVRHADAIGMIQDAGRAVRLTVQRGGSHVDATSVALPNRDQSALNEASEAGEGGSPRSSPTGSSANGSNGGVNAEKWWNIGAQQPHTAASAAALRIGQTPVGSDRTRSATDLAEVDDWNVKATPISSSGGGLLMQAPLWRPSHHTLPTFSGQQQQHLVESPPFSAGNKVRGSRTFGGTPVGSNASVVTDVVQRPRSLCTGVSTITSGYMSPGTTGSLRVIAELDPSHLSGRYSVAEATAMGRGVPTATAPFGFYETLLRQT